MSSNQELNGDKYETHVRESVRQIEQMFKVTIDSIAPRGKNYVIKFKDEHGIVSHWAVIHEKMARVLLKNMVLQ